MHTLCQPPTANRRNCRAGHRSLSTNLRSLPDTNSKPDTVRRWSQTCLICGAPVSMSGSPV